MGNTTTFAYNAAGNEVSTTSPLPLGEGQGEGGTTTTYGYNRNGQLDATVDPLGRVTADSYDHDGQPTATSQGSEIQPGMTGFSTTGSWTAISGGAFGQDGQEVSSSGSATTITATATWTFSGLVPGESYDVYMTWPSNAGGAAGVPFQIQNGGTTVTAATVNQSGTPADDLVLGQQRFEQMNDASFVASAADVVITLTNNTTASGYVLADAVCVMPDSPTSQTAYLCPGQVAGADFVRPVCRRGSQGTGQFNFAHRSMAA